MTPPPPPIVCSAPHITDGDTLRCGGHRIRLAGMDAPELSETRCSSGRDVWACTPYVRIYARAATARLTALTRGRVECRPNGQRSFNRIVARCYVGGYDLGAQLVAEGLARSEPEFGDPYRNEEEQARRRRRGVWEKASSTFYPRP